MSNRLNETIQNITVRHGVVLDKDDPILILHTMNERLIEDNRKAQQDLLLQFKEEMESITSQWKDDAKEKAQKVLNAALASSKEAMARLLQESTSESIQVIQKMISDKLTDAYDVTQQIKKFSRFALLSSAVMLVVSFFLTFVSLFIF